MAVGSFGGVKLMTDEARLPAGYRQGAINSITVVLTASLLFFRFIVFEPSSGPWNLLGVSSAAFMAVSLLCQLYTLWRALQPEDEQVRIYRITLRWFVSSIALLIVSLAIITVASIGH
jgi:hypothetical protein